MKNRLILFIVIFYFLLSVFDLYGQSRIPQESGNWLSSSNSGTAGGLDDLNVIFFEVPDTETNTLYFAVRDPGVSVDFTDEDSGSIGTLPLGDEDMKFTLVGGSGTLSNSDSVKYYYTVTDEAYTPATENSGYLEQKVYSTGDTTSDWVYFGGVSPSQGEHIGNKYYFKVVCHATSVNNPSGYKNGYQLDVSTSTSGTPTGVSGVRSFAYSWCVNLTERNKTWNLYPFVTEGSALQNIVAGLFDFDASDPVLVYDDGIGDNPVGRLYNKIPEGAYTTCTPSGTADGDGTVRNTSFAIPAGEDNGTWRLEILEGDTSFAVNTSEIWVWESAAAPGVNTNPTVGVDKMYRIYADSYTGLSSPSDPYKVVSSYEDGTATTGETERITCLLTDIDGNPVNASRTFSVSIGAGSITSVNALSSIDTATTATMVTDDYGIAWYEVTMAAADIASDIGWVNGGAGTFSSTGSDTTVVVAYVADPAPDISSASNKSAIAGAVPTPDTLPDIVITDSGTANIDAVTDLRINLGSLNAVFDTTASVTATISGTGTGRVDDAQNGGGSGTGVLTVTDTLDYEDSDKTAVIYIQADFAVGDILTISGLKLDWALAAESTGTLGLSVTGGAPFPSADDKLISINSSSSSTTAVWVGGEVGFETDWNRPNNWSNTDVPDTASETAEIPVTANDPQLPAGYNVTVDSISIDSGASLTTNANSLTANSIIVGGTLDASAQVNGADFITINNNLSGGGTLTGGDGNITVSGAVTVANFTASSIQTNIGGNFSSALAPNGGTIILDTTAGAVISNTGNYNNLTVSADKIIAADVNVTGTLNIGAASLDTAVYNLTAAALTHDSGGSITGTAGTVSINGNSSLADDITKTGGNISFTGGSVTLGGAVNLSTGADPVAGDVTLGSTFNNAQNLTVDAGGGNIAVNGIIGGGTPLGAVSLTSTAAINIGADISGTALTFTGPVNLTAGPLTLTGTNVNFTSTLDGGQALTVNGSGTTTFSGIVGSTPLTSITTDAAGTTAINTAAVTTSAAQNYNDNVTLGADAVISGTAITFGGSIDNGQALTVNGSGVTTFSGIVGGTPLTSLTTDAAGSTVINTTSVTTSGDQVYNDPVTLNSNTSFSTTNNNVSFASTLDSDAGNRTLTVNAGTGTVLFSDTVGAGNDLGSVAITADEIDFSGVADSFHGNSSLNLRPSANAVTVGIGGGAGTLDLSAADIDSLADGFSSIIIGRGGGTAAVTSDGGSFSDPVTIRSNGAGGSVTLTTAAITGTDNATVDITAPSINFSYAGNTVVTASQNITFTGAVNLNAASAVSTGGAGGNITFTSTIDNANNLTLTAGTGNVDITGAVGGTTPVSQFSIASAVQSDVNNISGTNIEIASGNIDLNGTAYTASTDDVIFTGAVDLDAGAATAISAGAGAGDDVTFTSTLDGGVDLTLNGAGSTTFSGLVGNTTPLTSITTDAAGTTAINTTVVATSGAQTYNDNVSLGADPVITGTAITFNGTVDNGQNLTVNAGGATTFAGLVGNTTPLTSITTNAAGTTAINTTVVATSGAQTYNDPVSLGADPVITGTAITFNGTVDNGQNLTVNAGGATTFAGLVGNTTPLTSITTNAAGTTAINTTVVATSGAQTYNDNVNLGADPVITGTAITFNGTVDNGQNLTVNAGGATTFAGLVGNTTPLTSITTNAAGTTAINTTVVATSGAQTYNDNVSLGADPVITGTAITFNGTVDNGQNLTVNAGGATTFAGLVGNTTPLTSITTDAAGTTAINTTVVATSGAQTYNDNVSLGADPVITGTAITFNGTVDNGQNLTVNAGGVTTFAGLVGNTTPLTSITTDAAGTTAINTTVVATTGTQIYNDPVSLGANADLSGTTVTFNGTANGGTNSLTVTGNAVFGNEDADTVTNVTTLSVTGTTQINTTAITTSAGQSYNLMLTLGTDVTLTGTTGTFTTGVTGGGNSLTLDFSGLCLIDGTFTGIADLTTGNGGTTQLSGTITTTGFQNYTDAAVLVGNVILNTTDSNVSFGNTVERDGVARTLTISAGNGTASFANTAGAGGDLGAVSITADEIDFSGVADSFHGNSTLVLQPSAAGTTIGIGGGAGTLDLSALDIASLADGFTSVTIGYAAGTAAVTSNGGSFSDPLTIQSNGAGGSVSLTTASITGTDNATVDITAPSINFSYAGNTVVTASQNITFTGAVNLNAASAVSTGGAGGNITFTSTIDNANNLTLTAGTGNVDITGAVGGTTPVSQFSIASAVQSDVNNISGTNIEIASGNIDLNGTAYTASTDDVIFTGAVDLDAGAATAISAGAGAGDDVTFTSTLDGGVDLTVNGGGTTEFAGVAGGITPLTSLTTDAAGTTNINTLAVSTTAAQVYNDNVSIGANANLTGTTAAFNGTVTGGGANSLTVTGNAVFGNAPADIVTNVTTLSVTGTTQINTNTVTTTGSQSYNLMVTLGTDVTLSGTTGTFTTGVTGAGNSLTLSYTGISLVNGTFTGILNLTANAGGTTQLSGNITTAGFQSYTDIVSVVASSVLTTTDSNVTFTDTVNGNAAYSENLTVDTGAGNISFGDGVGDIVGGATPLGDITITSAADVRFFDAVTADSITQAAGTGTSQFDSTVTLRASGGAGLALTGNNYTFSDAVNTLAGANGGTVTITNGGLLTIPAASNMNLDGAFLQNGAGPVNSSGDITTTGDDIRFDGVLSLGGDVFLDSGSASAGGITLSSAVSGLSLLTLRSGTGDVLINGTLGAGPRINGLAVTEAANIDINNTIDTDTQGIDITSAGTVNLAGAVSTINNGTVTITNGGLLTLEDGCDMILDGAFLQNGAGETVTGGGITTTDDNITFQRTLYFADSTNNMTFNTGAGNFLCNLDIHVYVPARTVLFFNDFTCRNFILYSGNINLNGNDITVINDFAAFGAAYDDVIGTGVTDLFSYDNPARSDNGNFPGNILADENAVLITAIPLPVPIAFTEAAYAGSFSDLSGSVITVPNNFYVNGCNMTGTGNWTLDIPDNASALTAFAEAYNMTASFSQAGAAGWVAAGENVTDGGNNSNWDFTSHTLLNGTAALADTSDWNNATGNIAGAYPAVGSDDTGCLTVYDNVIRVEIGPAATGKLFENTNNEISRAVTAAAITADNGAVSFTGAYTDRDCTISTDGAGDIDVFYLKVADADTWNTDADGTGAGNGISTDMGRPVALPAAPNLPANKAVVPDITAPKGTGDHSDGFTAGAEIYLSLVDNHKNRLTHYIAGTRFTGVADHCRPVVAMIETDRDNNTPGEEYNWHNYYQIKYSEPVNIGTDAGFVIGGAADNIRTMDLFAAAADYGGYIHETVADTTVTVEGYFSYPGKFKSGTKDPADLNPCVSSMFRGAPNAYGDHGLRIYAAGHSDGTTWTGYMYDVDDPDGRVATVAANSFITDANGNALDNRQFTIQDDALNAVDCDWVQPSISPYSGDPLVVKEVMTLDVDSDGFIDRLEFHILENNNILVDPLDNDPPGGLWDSSADHPEANGYANGFGMRETSLHDLNAFGVSVDGAVPGVPAGGFTFTSDVNNPLFGNIPDNNDTYFALTFDDSAVSLDYLTIIDFRYDSSVGRMTDLAGNLLRSVLPSANCMERVPPTIFYTIGSAGSNIVYVRFSEYVFHAADKSLVIDNTDFTINGGAYNISSIQEINSKLYTPGTDIGVLDAYFTLDNPLTADDLLALSIDPVLNAVSDNFDTPMGDDDEHRISDFAVGLVEPVWAADTYNFDNSDYDSSAIRNFTGRDKLLDTDITLEARLNTTDTTLPLTLFFDADIPSAAKVGDFWLPTLLTGYNETANSSARGLNPYTSAGALKDFLIPGSDSDVSGGKDLEFIFNLNGLYAGYLSDPNDPTTLKPWVIPIKGLKQQRAGVTILNNVINPRNGEKAILRYELEKSGIVTINIFSLSGDVVKTLFKGRQASGSYSYTWDGKNTGGRDVARGIYFIRIVGPGIDEYRKVMVVK